MNHSRPPDIDYDNPSPEHLPIVRVMVQEGLDDLAAGRYVEVNTGEEMDRLFEDITARGAARARDRDR